MAAPVKKPAGDSELQAQLQMIESNRNSQVGGMQALGSQQDSNIQNIYGSLRGGLQQGVGVTQGIYNRGQSNIANAFSMGGQQAAASSLGSVASITDNAQRLGMDERALGEVTGKLALQQGLFAGRNAQSSRERQATMSQQGTGQTAIAQMAVAAAQHMESQGRSDLSKKILTEVAKANTSAAQQNVGATGAAVQRESQRAAEASREASSAMRSLISERRAMEREARSSSREKDPLDQAIKMMRLQMMEKDFNGKPESARDRLTMMDLEDRMAERESSQGESADDIWADIYNRFPNHGSKTIPLLQAALKAGATAKDESGMTDRSWVTEKGKGLDQGVVLEQLARLHRANKRAR